MPDDKIKISALPSALSLNNTDEMPVVQESGGSKTTKRSTVQALGSHIAETMNFSSELETTANSLVGAINEAASDKNLADQYSNLNTYEVGDFVIYKTVLYKCITAVTVPEDFDSTKWTVAKVSDLVGADMQDYYTKEEVDEIVDKIAVPILSPNLLDTNNFTQGKYLYEGILYDNANMFVTDYIPCTEGDVLHYQYTNSSDARVDANDTGESTFRFVEAYDSNNNYISGSVKSIKKTYTAPVGTSYVRVTIQYQQYNNTNFKDCAIVKYVGEIYPFIPYGEVWKVQLAPNLVTNYNKTQFGQYRGVDLTVSKKLFDTSIKAICLNASIQFSSFTSFRVGLKNVDGLSDNFYAEVDSSKLYLYDYGYNNPQTTEYAHGLTISNDLTIKVVSDNTGKYTISISSMGVIYEAPAFYPTRSSLCQPYCLGSVVGSGSFTAFAKDIDKPIWLFGDSYLGYSTSRWLFYLLTKDKPQKVLFDGFGGEGSVQSIRSFKALLEMGTPKYVVWCLGMNDGSDGDTPSTAWKNAIDELKTICDEVGIKLLLATIPTVPNINHEKKNAWVRNSGLQYIDFASAVGANSSGVWYSGMLYSDNVHPTDLGAVALYYQAITDCPQLMMS